MKILIRIVVWGSVAVAIGITLYMMHLSTVIDKRFSARRWSIPSRVYSDSTLLYPAQSLNVPSFREKLGRLGYHEVSHEPGEKGEMRRRGSILDIYLHELTMPSKRRSGFSVSIKFMGNRISSMVRNDTGESLALLDLEPEEIMLFFGPDREQRRLISINEVPLYLKYAVLAAEDSRFYRHHGVDFRGILRALYTNIRHGEIRQGGSTLTQQLAKNYFLTPERTLRRKIKEFLMAVTMEVIYDKDTVFEIYLNEIYFGQKGSIAVHGVGEASHYYFGKDVGKLTVGEAATIAGLIKGPNRYSPYSDPERCRKRRDAVLQDMFRNGWITAEEVEGATATAVVPVGYSDYRNKAPYFVDYLSQQLPVFYSSHDLSSLGLSVYTTLDTQVQMAAERALERGLARLERENPTLKRSEPVKQLQGAVIVMRPKTGAIIAMAGGRDYSVSQFNRITQARRQPGSAFKPFVYLTALNDFTPSSIFSNERKSYEIDGTVWQPQNVGPVMENGLRLRTALARSDNLATVDCAMKTGLKRIVNTALSLRFSTPMKPQPALALGAFEVIPLELARAYCTFAADGVLPHPLSMKAVIDEKGRVLERRHLKIERIISPEKAFMMNSLLLSVVEEGTARSLKWRNISYPVAGKTGTTNDYRDAWFVGYTPDILALVWVGYDDGSSVYAQGATAALPIWADLMRELPQYTSGGWFRE
ncbi:MAG: PBP1A family penicillin-binding protein, partial [Deltaproteobacteria bacterium]|nr:PBP1A family penicillin-binding protein [Deltaproteobacteria bacterium]